MKSQNEMEEGFNSNVFNPFYKLDSSSNLTEIEEETFEDDQSQPSFTHQHSKKEDDSIESTAIEASVSDYDSNSKTPRSACFYQGDYYQNQGKESSKQLKESFNHDGHAGLLEQDYQNQRGKAKGELSEALIANSSKGGKVTITTKKILGQNDQANRLTNKKSELPTQPQIFLKDNRTKIKNKKQEEAECEGKEGKEEIEGKDSLGSCREFNFRTSFKAKQDVLRNIKEFGFRMESKGFLGRGFDPLRGAIREFNFKIHAI